MLKLLPVFILAGLQTMPATRLAEVPIYRCAATAVAPQIDGRPDDAAWRAIEPLPQFVHILGEASATLQTRVKMCWDETHLYVLAEMEEPHVWAAMTERNGPLFRESAFEMFIDPDGDSKSYYEFEVNPLGTVMELTMDRPYKEGGKNTFAGIEGLKMAVWTEGTINDPSDVDKRWVVEMAIPFAGLAKIVDGVGAGPKAGETWRVNFMRMHHGHRVENGKYVKEKPTDHWVWSPQGVINMHVPDRWGKVTFVR